MAIVVVGLGYVAMDAKFDPLASGLSVSSIVLASNYGSSWPHNLSITTIQLHGRNYAQWTKSVEVYFIAKKQYKFLVNNPQNCKEVGEAWYED